MGHEWERVMNSPAPVKQLREAEQAPGPQAGQVTAVSPAPEQRGHHSHPWDPRRAAVREAAGGRPPAGSLRHPACHRPSGEVSAPAVTQE